MEPKKWYESKSLWMQLIGFAAVAYPPSRAFLEPYFMEAGMGWAFINMVLRLITKDKIQIL